MDVDFRNAYNSMSQPELWDILRKFGIPDVDFLESIYDKASVRLAPNGCRNASITFDTGVCQGSVLSPLLFILFINALARALTATGKKRGIAHGMRDVDQFNNLAFCDDMSIFAQNEKGMQQLLEHQEIPRRFDMHQFMSTYKIQKCACRHFLFSAQVYVEIFFTCRHVFFFMSTYLFRVINCQHT